MNNTYYKKADGTGPFTALDFGFTYMAKELIEQLGLTEVTADYQPPVDAAVIKQAKIDALNAEYDSQFESLSKSLGIASLANDTDLIAELRTEYTDLKTSYTQELEVINNG